MTGPERVQKALDDAGLKARVEKMPDSTRTAAEAASAVGCTLGQIAKSLIFRAKATDAPILAIVSGDNRLDTKKLEALIGEPVGKADADFVRARTGYAIGGIPPLGHSEKLRVFFDEDLFRFAEIWAAAGHPHCVFKTDPTALMAAAGAVRANLKS
ncbi:YbaK/EbsC family protein [Kordiimonas marina]|uniref:YbaK/EbsC family protein n=1 Tax=Kordiimonas marina TaxID=2872312 RepID=UPI001FF25E4F|nr:YbaK/EbsC family protein [Kordiimonas marina]MCJ9430466.1 YbaK/EbsC family protein [Kordiimonas marina]